MNELDKIVAQLTPKCKEAGYKKNRLTWYKTKNNLTVVFSIQKSQYGSDIWYYSFGVCLHEIAEANTQSIRHCQIFYRTNHIVDGVLLTAENLIRLIDRWDALYGDMKRLRICALQGKLPGQCTVHAMRYLTSVNLANL